jgi:hypothetical protein
LKLRDLMYLLWSKRDLSKEIDSLAQNKSCTTAFYNSHYTKAVAQHIASLTRNNK